eukprot:8158553-Lingulodinium_polyedra.AAC.1
MRSPGTKGARAKVFWHPRELRWFCRRGAERAPTGFSGEAEPRDLSGPFCQLARISRVRSYFT